MATTKKADRPALPMIMGDKIECEDRHVIGAGYGVDVKRDAVSGQLVVIHNEPDSWFSGIDLKVLDGYDVDKGWTTPKPMPLVVDAEDAAEVLSKASTNGTS